MSRLLLVAMPRTMLMLSAVTWMTLTVPIVHWGDDQEIPADQFAVVGYENVSDSACHAASH